MTARKQIIKIAEVCGWFVCHPDILHGIDPMDGLQDQLPNYFGDLNAMHEAEKILDQEQHIQYRLELMLRVGGYTSHLATAPQRAEAFLKILNLWED